MICEKCKKTPAMKASFCPDCDGRIIVQEQSQSTPLKAAPAQPPIQNQRKTWYYVLASVSVMVVLLAFVRYFVFTTTVTVGDIIPFGNHNWLVLDVQGNHALIITENIISRRSYHGSTIRATWETSDIRHYLNSTFLNTFSSRERRRIRETTVTSNNNPWYGTNGGNNTVDYVFLLSIEEVVRYFGDSGQLQNRPQGAWVIDDGYNGARAVRTYAGAASWWWLRSPGGLSLYAARLGLGGARAAHVGRGGSVNVRGLSVSDLDGGVRPALWLRL